MTGSMREAQAVTKRKAGIVTMRFMDQIPYGGIRLMKKHKYMTIIETP
jgi:hypothetical protein